MSRQFPLAGLLRIRKVQEDAARQRLADANRDLTQAVEAAGGIGAYLHASPSGAGTSASLLAIAATRAAASSMLATLQMERELSEQRVEQAQAALQEARTSSLGLEKLHARHRVSVVAEENHAEQVVLDEASAAAWHRTRDGKAAR